MGGICTYILNSAWKCKDQLTCAVYPVNAIFQRPKMPKSNKIAVQFVYQIHYPPEPVSGRGFASQSSHSSSSWPISRSSSSLLLPIPRPFGDIESDE